MERRLVETGDEARAAAAPRSRRGRYWIDTFGCQMNVRDSELFAEQLEAAGWRPAARREEAELVLVNTCSVRDKAEHKLYSELGQLRSWKRRTGGRIVVAGCVAQQERERILARAPYVDLVLGTHQVRRLVPHLEAAARGERLAVAWRNREGAARLADPDPVRGMRPSVFVTIQEGCDNLCTFCIVPFTRGREASRAPEAIEAEVRAAVAAGAKEVVLLGQNVNSYGAKQPGWPSFAELLARIHAIEGLERIRFTSPHPRDYDDELVAAYARLPKLCPSAHLPVQAGSDRILAAMRRGYTAEAFVELTDRLRAARPGIHFSTDVIVGFPGEERADFEATLALLERVRFAQVYAFVYSPRPGTPAARLPDPVPPATKRAWLQELLELQRRIQLEDHQAFVGRRVEVLWTEHRDGTLKGRSPEGRVVHAPGGPERVGELALVEIASVTANALYGTEVPAAQV